MLRVVCEWMFLVDQIRYCLNVDWLIDWFWKLCRLKYSNNLCKGWFNSHNLVFHYTLKIQKLHCSLWIMAKRIRWFCRNY